MAISRAQAGNTATGTSTTPSATLTNPPVPGNVIVFGVAAGQGVSSNGNFVHVTGDDNNSDVHWFLRVVQPGDSATQSVTLAGSTAWVCRIEEITGSSDGWAVDLVGHGFSGGAETSHALAVAGPTGSSSTLHPDEMAFGLAGFNVSQTSVPWNNSLTNDSTNLLNGTRSGTFASRILTATASFSTLSIGTWTTSTATGGFAFFTLVALGPDPGRPRPNPERIRITGPFKPSRPVDATPSGSFATPTQVQKHSNTSATSSVAVGSGQGWSAPTSGNTLIAVAAYQHTAAAGTQTAPAITGFSAAATDAFGTAVNAAVSILWKISDGTETTITASKAGDGGTVAFMDLHCFEYSGLAASSPFDVGANFGLNDNNGVTSRATGTTGATAQAVELAIVAAGTGNSVSALSWSNSFGVEIDTTRLHTGSLALAAAGTKTSTASWTTSRIAGGAIATFKAAASAGPVTGTANLTGTGDLSAIPTMFGVASITGAGDLSAIPTTFGTATLSGAGDLSCAGTYDSATPEPLPARLPKRIRPFGPFKPAPSVLAAETPHVYGVANLSGTGSLTVDPRFLSLDGTSGTYVSTPDSAAASITGDITIRIDAALDDWTPTLGQTLVAKDDATNQISYVLQVSGTTGNPTAFTSPDGTAGAAVTGTASASNGVTDGQNRWIEWSRQVNDGSGHTVDTFRSASDYNPADPASGTWSAIGSTVTTAGTTSIFDSTSDVTVGAFGSAFGTRLHGRVYRAQILSGHQGGTVKVDLRPADYVSGTTLTSSTTGEVWTLHGAAVVVATADPTGTANLTGTGDLSATGVATSFGTAALSGAGSLSATGTLLGTASLSGAGSLSATLQPAPVFGTATLFGAGDLSVRASDPALCLPIRAIGGPGVTAAYGSSGATSAVGSSGITFASDICVHAGEFAISAIESSAVLTGAGSLSATGVAGSTVFGSASLTGSGSLSAAGKPTAFGTAPLTGAGSLAATGTIGSAASLTGAGSLSASGTLNRSAALSGAGSLTAVPTTFGSAVLSGAGSLSATSGTPLPDLVVLSGDWS